MDRWIGRRANPKPSALAAIKGRQPFTVITGGSDGIGSALAELCLRRGENILIVARSKDRLEKVANALSHKTNNQCLTLGLDITDHTAAVQIEKSVAAANGYIDVLINNAGIGLSGDFTNQSPDDLKHLIDLNITAATTLMRFFLPGMCDRGRGGIINIASLGAAVPGPYQATYYASKSYLTNLTEAVAHEVRGRGVRLLAVLPGPVATTFHSKMAADDARYRAVLPALTPAVVATSTLAAFDRGQTVTVPRTPGPLLSYALRVLPHPVAVPIVGLLLRRPQKSKEN